MLHVLLLLAAIGLVPFEKDGSWGYRDRSGKVVIPPRFAVAREFSREGIAAVVDDQGWAYVDSGGKVLIRPVVVDNGPDYFTEGLARFSSEGKVGFFDRAGKVVIPARYFFALPFSEGYAAVCDGCSETSTGEHKVITGGRWGFIDRTGRLAIPLQFSEARSFERGRARVRTAKGWHEIGSDGKPR